MIGGDVAPGAATAKSAGQRLSGVVTVSQQQMVAFSELKMIKKPVFGVVALSCGNT